MKATVLKLEQRNKLLRIREVDPIQTGLDSRVETEWVTEVMIKRELTKYSIVVKNLIKLVILAFLSYYAGVGNKSQIKSLFERRVDAKHPTKVLLLASHRSGSSFLGEIFNQNPNAFYLFEPLAAVQETHSTDGCADLMEEKVDLLDRWFTCNAPHFYRAQSDDQKKHQNGLGVDESNKHGRCVEVGLCSRNRNQWSCDTGICHERKWLQKPSQVTGITTSEEECKSCRPINAELMSSICSSKSIVAPKTIRLCSTRQITTLMRLHPDMKVIMLYRDPRGIYGSRKAILGEEQALQMVTRTCNYFHETLDSFKNNENVMKIRYEDIALNQWEASKAIYDFIGHKMPARLIEWINNSSKSNEGDSSQRYSTKRNSTYVVSKWRHTNDFNEIEKIQGSTSCTHFMRKCGYELVNDPRDLTGDHFNPINYETDFVTWKRPL